MKNIDIHNNLPEHELRDFLAKQLELNECYYAVTRIERELKEWQERLEKARNKEAIQTLLKLKGWDDLDCSSDISDFQEQLYFPFIGTKEEYKELFGKEY